MVSSVLEFIQLWLVRPQHMACTLRIRGDDRENSAREKFVRLAEIHHFSRPFFRLPHFTESLDQVLQQIIL